MLSQKLYSKLTLPLFSLKIETSDTCPEKLPPGFRAQGFRRHEIRARGSIQGAMQVAGRMLDELHACRVKARKYCAAEKAH